VLIFAAVIFAATTFAAVVFGAVDFTVVVFRAVAGALETAGICWTAAEVSMNSTVSSAWSSAAWSFDAASALEVVYFGPV
jgi:hypothetical protein